VDGEFEEFECITLVGKSDGMRKRKKPRHICENNNKMDF
jgi:hypothetical protein